MPFVVLKALAFDSRREPKDAYDLVYVLRNIDDGPESVAQSITKIEQEQESFRKAIDVLSTRFSEIIRDGPVKYAQFVEEPGAEATAFATVQEFLMAVEKSTH